MNSFRKYLLLLARILLGVMWVLAGVEKIADPSQFSRDISNYHLLPFGIENTVAIILPWLELFIGLSLIFGLYISSASLISGVLMLVFVIFIAQAMVRGFNIECGCGLKEGQMVGWGKIFENLLYFLGSYFILIRKEKTLEILPKVRLSSST
ncbi:MAG: hypothetical protein CMG04_10955 [Candidatus Marinimicrobia bacterium]|nr:hypothetical protein [Candidatus Neomarinimicrobiota bacterium]|tara:strand:- start:285 stop:740 length:456 start_codon:yes stop_codon:yes gene_type:complete